MDATEPKRRWFHPTLSWLVLGLLAIEGLLFLAERLWWLPKGWPVLLAIAAVAGAMLLMFLWFVLALVFRWRFQFSLRSLLVMVVVVAIPCSWLAVDLRAAREQRESMVMIESSGCKVFYCSIDEKGNVDSTKSVPLLYSEERLAYLLGWDFFCTARHVIVVRKGIQESPFYVYIHHTHDVAGAVLLALRNLPDLRFVDLSGMPINDSDLEHVMPLKELRQLDLTGTQITDEGVKKLQQALPNCKIIR